MEITNRRQDIVRYQLIAFNDAAKNVTDIMKVVIVEKLWCHALLHQPLQNIAVSNCSTGSHCTTSHQIKK